MTLIISFNGSIVQLQQTYRNLQEKAETEFLIQALIILLVFESKIL